MLVSTEDYTDSAASPPEGSVGSGGTSSFWDDFAHAVEEETALHDILVKQEKIRNCGLHCMHFPMPGTTHKKKIILHCGQWRDKACPQCFSFRQDGFKDRIKTAIAQGKSVYALPIYEAEKKLQGLEKDDYFKLPSNNATTGGTLFYDATNRKKIGKQVLSTTDISDEEWDELTNTAEGFRTSGSLGKLPDPAPITTGDEPTPEIYTTTVSKITTPNVPEAEHAWFAACRATSHMPESCPDELILQYNARITLYLTELNARNVEVISHKLIIADCEFYPKQVSTSELFSNPSGNKSVSDEFCAKYGLEQP